MVVVALIVIIVHVREATGGPAGAIEGRPASATTATGSDARAGDEEEEKCD
jgi:hypothetical protein